MSEWIVIPNWEKFQHRADRSLPWLKLYIELSGRDDWRHITLAEKGLLVSIWIEYRRGKGQLRTSDMPGLVAQKIPRRYFDSLAAAGFIRLSATQPKQLEGGLDKRRSREEPPNPPQSGGPNGRSRLTKKDLRKYTGCRLTRGSHSTGYVRDPLGTDKPPADWPHERPSADEIRAALETS